SLVSQKTRVELLRRVEILGVLKSGATAARRLAVVEYAKTEQRLPHPVFLEQPTRDVMASRKHERVGPIRLLPGDDCVDPSACGLDVAHLGPHRAEADRLLQPPPVGR